MEAKVDLLAICVKFNKKIHGVRGRNLHHKERRQRITVLGGYPANPILSGNLEASIKELFRYILMIKENHIHDLQRLQNTKVIDYWKTKNEEVTRYKKYIYAPG